jgi:transposase-like protein
MFQGINAIEFSSRFKDNDSCYEYLLEKKWGNGYQCIRCGCKESNKGRTRYYKRCKQCGYDESVTANTVFHDIKMPILKAFHLAFRIGSKKKGMSTVELGNEVGVEQKTAWLFKRKIQEVLGDKVQLKGNVHADETIVGGHSKGTAHRGRSLKEKSAVVVAAEILDDGRTGNINFETIENFEADTLKFALKDMIDGQANIVTDQHKSYESLKDAMKIETVKSEKGNALKEIHKQIMLFKNWLRGIHHKCSKALLKKYLNEYRFRFNNRNRRHRIFDILIGRLMHYAPQPYPVLKNQCE